MDVSLKHKVKSDYKTEADIPWEFIGREGGDAGRRQKKVKKYQNMFWRKSC